MRLRPYSAAIMAIGGVILMALGMYFAFLRPPLLPEDSRFMGASLVEIQLAAPAISIWLRRVFWVMGGQMFAAGLLTTFVAGTAFRARDRGAAGVLALAGATSIGLMAAVNFLISSDFKWLIVSFVLPWVAALTLYWLEGRRA